MDTTGTWTALRTFEAAEAGVSRRALAGGTWEHISHGLHGTPGTVDDLRSHCAALLRVLPEHSAFGHITGARLRGWPLPWLPRQLPVFAASPSATHVQRAGAYVRRLRGWRSDRVNGLPVLVPADLLLDLACDLQLVDLVSVVDGALRAESLRAATILADLPARAHGAPRLRRALALSDPRSESVRETALRLVHVLAGITQVECQVNVGDEDGPVGRADLWLVGTRRIVEYDGAHHRRKARHRRDLMRDRDLQRSQWERFGYSDDDLCHAPGQIIRDAESALRLRPDPRRIQRWLAHARRSTLTAPGRLLLERRLDRYAAAAERRTPE